MRRSRKIMLIALLTLVVVGGSLGGVAIAQTENGDDSPPKARYGALLDRACAIYQEDTGVAIDAEKLADALAQAGQEKMTEARNQFRQRLIDEGTVTQEQLDEYDKWLESMPDVPFPLGPRGDFGKRGFGGPGGGFHHWGGLCAPQTTE